MKNSKPKLDVFPTLMNFASREKAKNILEREIKRRKQEVLARETILRSIAWDKLTSEQDEALWEFLPR